MGEKGEYGIQLDKVRCDSYVQGDLKDNIKGKEDVSAFVTFGRGQKQGRKQHPE
ncbi:hypothetical protein [Alteribacter lacisalsi]|uniref:hypothetical protein n=1 Tax=Alteribacter lacisalsi TaxID=2045244 RepID=UPI001375018A|nr:hypothetical protein [Alteribacter lacisalsi]